MPTVEQPLRVAEFDALFALAVSPAQRPTPGRLEVVLPVEAEPVARDLAARESACCSFFAFTLQPAVGGIELAVEVPAARVEVLDAIQRRIEPTVVSGSDPRNPSRPCRTCRRRRRT